MGSASPTALTAYQRDIWTASSRTPDLPRFNIGEALRIAGDVNFEVLKECLQRGVRCNDAFHLRFAEMDGIPVRWTEVEIPEIEILDFSGEADPRAECLTWMEHAARRPFDLNGGRMFDMALLCEDESIGYLCITAHPIIVDDWGMDQFARRILADYAHVIRAGSYPESRPVSYLTAADNEARYRGSSRWQRDRNFYRETFANLDPPLFPAKGPTASAGTRRSARHSFLIERQIIDRIREQGNSVSAFLTAVFANYLSRVHRCEEVVLGIPFLNRHGISEMRTVGHFVNTLPLRVATHGQRSMRDIATLVEAATVTTKRHERLALGDLLRALPSRGTGPRRLFDVTFSYLCLPNRETVPGLSLERVALPHGHDQDALTVHIRDYDDAGDVCVELDYALDVFDEDFPVEAAARHIKTLLEQAVDRVEEPVRNLPMLALEEHELLIGKPAPEGPLPSLASHAPDEQQTLEATGFVVRHVALPDRLTDTDEVTTGVEIWERTNVPLLVDAITAPQAGTFGLTEEPGDVVRRFERQARRMPDAVAVTMSGQQWTYDELDRAADLVARRLLRLGSSPGARVGIAMDRSPEMIAVVLGIGKAGAACVPLDVRHPQERIAAMLAQARPFRVIAHARHAHLVPEKPEVLLAESVVADTGREPDADDAPRLPPIGPQSIAYVLFTSGSMGPPKGVAMPHRVLAGLVAWQNRAPSGAVGGTTLQFAPLCSDVSFQEIFSTLCGGGTLLLVSEERRRNMVVLLRLLDHEGVERLFLPYDALQQLAETAVKLELYPRRLRVLVSYGERPRMTGEIRRLCAALPGCLLENQYGPTKTHVMTGFSMTGDPAAFPDLVAEQVQERFISRPSRPEAGWLCRTGDLDRREPAPGKLAEHCPGLREADVVARRPEEEPAFVTAFMASDEAAVDLGRRLGALLPEHLVPSRFTWLRALPLTPSGTPNDAALRGIPLAPLAPSAERTESRDRSSLTAMRLVPMIEKRYAMGAPVSVIAEAPTIAALADKLHRESAMACPDPLVRMHTFGTRPPLLVEHSVGGDVLCYVPFARQLPEDRPVQAVGAEPGTEPLRSGPDLACRCLDAIRSLRPSGSYTIGDWSFGGFVALEMARQAAPCGEAVHRLVLLDPTTPGTAVPAPGLPPCGSPTRVRRLVLAFRAANWQASLDCRPDRCDQDVSLPRATAPSPTALWSALSAPGGAHRDPSNGWPCVATVARRIGEVSG